MRRRAGGELSGEEERGVRLVKEKESAKEEEWEEMMGRNGEKKRQKR